MSDHSRLALGAVLGSGAAVLVRRLRRIEGQRRRALEDLQRLNAELEERVRLRSEELERERTLRAVYEDRERIAGDLHDRVIQRVFAAGLQLQGVAPKLPDDLRGVFTEAMQELDASIVALRGAIFALTQPSVEVDTNGALLELAHRARPMLRFAPRVHVHGSTAAISRELHGDLLSVAQEALSNVARHAHATRVQLDLVVEDGRARLEVADDGVGMPEEVPHSSGTRNIRRRAADRGGTAVWSPVEPTGTRLVWSVPLG